MFLERGLGFAVFLGGFGRIAGGVSTDFSCFVQITHLLLRTGRMLLLFPFVEWLEVQTARFQRILSADTSVLG